ncbi:unnamed protein product [Ilex paraguariensis]|uniref:Uncharacterized protein n=1 Tax=Ilex paraguariensis TaxID=185542 RepID=A0ABC8R0R9_9AQUA
MAVKIGSSFSCVSTSLSSPIQSRRSSQMSLTRGAFDSQKSDAKQLRNAKVVKSCQFMHGKLKVKYCFPKRRHILFATSEDQLEYSELKSDASDEEEEFPLIEDMSPVDSSYVHIDGTGGRPGLISFYNRPYRKEDANLVSSRGRNQDNLLWFAAPAVLVSSFIFPSLYLRRLLSTVFEDSLLTGRCIFLGLCLCFYLVKNKSNNQSLL